MKTTADQGWFDMLSLEINTGCRAAGLWRPGVNADELESCLRAVRASSGRSVKCFEFSLNDSCTLSSRSRRWFMAGCWLLQCDWRERPGWGCSEQRARAGPLRKGVEKTAEKAASKWHAVLPKVTRLLHVSQWPLVVDSEWDINGDY